MSAWTQRRDDPPPRKRRVNARRALGRTALLVAATLLLAARDASAFAETDPRYRAGIGLLARGLHAEAATELRAFLESDAGGSSSEAPTARYALAVCASRLGRHDEAASQLDRIPETALAASGGFTHAPDALLLRARSALELEDDAMAIRALERLAREHPQYESLAAAESLRGEALHRAGRHAESLAVLRAAITRWPQAPDRDRNELLCASAELAAGDPEAAAARLGSLRSRSTDAALGRSAALLHAQALHRLQRWEECASTCRMALGDAPASGGEPAAALLRSALFEMGDRALAAGDVDAARARFQELVAAATGPERDDALLRLALCAQRAGRPAEALTLLDELVDPRPEPPALAIWAHACFERAQSLIEMARLDDAKTQLDALIEATGASEAPETTRFISPSLRHLATIASRQGRTDDAASLLARLGRESDEASRSALDAELGGLLLAAGRYAEAEAALNRCLEQQRRSSAPRSTDAATGTVALKRAIAIARQGRHEDALAAFDEADLLGREVASRRTSQGDVRSELEPVDPGVLATALSERAGALAALGRDDEAAAVRARLVDEGPRECPPLLRAHAAIEIARFHVEAERWTTALERLDTADEALSAVLDDASAQKEQSRPVHEHERYLRGLCELRLGRPAKAAAALEKFGERFPGSALASSAALLRGEALLAEGRPAQAADTFAALLTMPGSAAAPADAGPAADLRAAALLRLGEARAAAQQWAASEEAFAALLTEWPAHPQWYQARFGQGWAREQQGRHDAAIEAYRDVVARHDGVTAARAQFQIGECLFAQKKLDDAVRELVKVDVLYAAPEWSAAALYEAGRCLEAAGRPNDAKRQYTDVLSRFPDTRWAALARERIPSLAPDPLPGMPSTR